MTNPKVSLDRAIEAYKRYTNRRPKKIKKVKATTEETSDATRKTTIPT